VTVRVLHAVAMASALALATACGRSSAAVSESAPVIKLVTPAAGVTSHVEVTGLSDDTLERLNDARYTHEQWSALLRVSVAQDAPAMLGTYQTSESALTFTPAFPFDAGRTYIVRLDPARLPGGMPTAAAIVTDVGLPPSTAVPSTSVARLYPSSDVVPENLLRMYIEFSAPMGRRNGLDHLQLFDDKGAIVEAPFLPIDYEFWSPDRRRFTVFFDPGRVKDGILPNQEMGRPLKAGRLYTLVVGREWRDEHGLPLKEEYRHVLRVGPAQTHQIEPSTWRILPPPAGRRDPLVVTFREPLDHGLLMRALGVRAGGAQVAGDIRIEAGETRWVFTPHEPWRAGSYQLLALSILEDVAGNQIGRAFEVDNFDTVDKAPDPQSILLPFTIGSGTTG
jgi:hypothetical protein